jgi:hypothetical protein
MEDINLVEVQADVQNVQENEQPLEISQPKKKKELSQKQIEHLNNIRIKALEKKREIKLKKNEEYKNKVSKPQVIEQEIKQPEVKPPENNKKKVIKKVIEYVEADSDEEEQQVMIQAGAQRCGIKKSEKQKPEIVEQPKQIEKSYSDLLYESSLERMQNKIMNERAKHLITSVIPNYY